METRHSFLKNALSITALVISLAALQCPLWLPALATHRITAKTGGTAVFDYEHDIEKATILRSTIANISAAGPHQLMIHGNKPGRTTLIINYKDGKSRLYEVVVLPG
jgi:Flp pilus assembly secretin CpaC